VDLQFKVRCEISKDDFARHLGETDIESIVYNVTPGISVRKNHTDLTFEISNDNMKELLFEMVDESYYDRDKVINITNVIVRGSIILFDVNLKIDFFSYESAMLENLIENYNGVIKKMDVKDGKKPKSNSAAVLSLSPLQSNFSEVVSLLNNVFLFSVKRGGPIVSVVTSHALHYIDITVEFKDKCHKDLFVQLTKMMKDDEVTI